MKAKKTTKTKVVQKEVKHKETAQHKDAFYTWYEFDRDVAKSCKKLRISDRTFYSWIKRFKWEERANKLDNLASEKAERKLVNDKAKRQSKMLKEDYDSGTALLSKGLTYLKDNPLENGHQAIRAVETGIKIRREAEGLPTFLLELLDKTNDELRQELYELAHDESEAAEDGSDSADS